MFEVLAYAVLLIGMPVVLPLLVVVDVFRSVRRREGGLLGATLFAAGAGGLSLAVVFYIGVLGAIGLGCALHTDPECEHVATDALFGDF